MNDKQEGILFTIDCLKSHKYNFDYNLEELIKEAKQLQSNWNSLKEIIKDLGIDYLLDKMNELEKSDIIE